MPFMKHAPRDGAARAALGGQQAERLRQLREASESLIHDKHLERPRLRAAVDSLPTAHAVARVPGAEASRTVEAIILSRAQDTGGSHRTTVRRFREQIRAARGGIETARPVEAHDGKDHDGDDGSGLRGPPLRPRTTATTEEPRSVSSGGGLRQRIAAVRRRRGLDAVETTRRLGRDELEWIEKQRQFVQRIAALEKDCAGTWQSYFASAGIGGGEPTGEQGAPSWPTTVTIQREMEESTQLRREDSRALQQQLFMLRSKADVVANLVQQMRDGKEFIANLQDVMEEFEQALGEFRTAQRATYDAYVVEEKVVERDLEAFLDKMEQWEQEDAERKAQRGKGPRGGRPTTRSGTANGTARRHWNEVGGDDDQQASTITVPSESDLVKRVRQLDARILQSGGLKGGWDDREHASFTSMLLKCGLTDEILMVNHISKTGESNQQQDTSAAYRSDDYRSDDYETLVARFMRMAVKGIVTKTENSVRHHLEWYLGHLLLLQEKKDTIARWRAKKEAERQHFISQGLHEINNNNSRELTGSPTPSPDKPDASQEDTTALLEKRQLAEAQERARKTEQLAQWKEEKDRRELERQEEEAKARRRQEVKAARKRQELLEKKQQIMLYRLQKEEEAQLLQRGGKTSPATRSPARSPDADKELLERSKQAIELAKAKRAKIQARAEQQQQQSKLPARPRRRPSSSGSRTDSEASPGSQSPREKTLTKPTKAFESRNLTKLDLRRKERDRERQGAHETYFPGSGAISDVKIKSFGHIPIAPRAIPSWRRNL